MTERLDAMIGREYEANGEERTAWTKIGVAFALRNGGYRVQLKALPTPRMGQNGQIETSFVLMPPRQDDRQSQPRQQSRPQSAPSFDGGPDDDSIPF